MKYCKKRYWYLNANPLDIIITSASKESLQQTFAGIKRPYDAVQPIN